MDTESLIAVGLTPLQAEVYALLLEHGELKPPQVALKLKITRTNAYKVLDKLVEIQLATKSDKNKAAAYTAANPIALSSLTAQYRAEATAREEAANRVMHELLEKFNAQASKPAVEQASGQAAVAELYRKQLGLREEIYFVHAKADVAAMGFDTMHEIRVTPARHNLRRHSIMMVPDKAETPINHASHERSNMNAIWADSQSYTAPVEWSVTKSSLLIAAYAGEPQAILIVDPVVAGSFLQLFKLLSSLLRHQPTHQKVTANKTSA